jgi:ornithine cyclodeaminase/alanine dehydrogenase-like protein (mu-crystallin family)
MATKVLANPETPVLGILGAGVQARAHIQALSCVRKLERIKVYSPSGTSAAHIKRDLEAQIAATIEISSSAEQAVRDSDLVLTVSTAKEPIIKPEWVKPGAHINAVGSHRPDLREIDSATLARARIVVDSHEAVMAECGDILLALKENAITEKNIDAEIGEVLAGSKTGRSSPEEITLYKSVGVAIQDIATANLVYQKALQQKVGTEVII